MKQRRAWTSFVPLRIWREFSELRRDVGRLGEQIDSKSQHIYDNVENLRHLLTHQSNDIEYLKRRTYDFINGSATPLFDSILSKVTRPGFKMFIDGRDYGSGSNMALR